MLNADDPKRKKLPDGPMVVEATKPGLYGHYRDSGERFSIRNGRQDFSFNWMKPVTGRAAAEVKEQEEEKAKESQGSGGDAGDVL